MTTARRATRVALDTTALLGPRTGIGTFVAELVDGLADENGIDTTAFVVSWSGRGRAGPELPAQIHRGRRTLPARLARTSWLHTDRPTVTWFAGKVDLVHGPNFVVPPGDGAAELVTVHDLTCIRYPQLCTPDTLEYPCLIRRALARGAHIHTVSQYVADEVIAEFGVEPSRVTVVPNGVSPATPFVPGSGRALSGGGDFLLALGTAEPRKDLPSLVTAFENVASARPDLTLVIAGPDGWGVDELDESIARSAARSRIRRIARYVSEAERSALVAEAAALVYPSVYEGFGLPPLEAMAAGTPVVATRAGAVPEVVADAAVLTDVGDVDGLAAAIEGLLSDESARERLITDGRTRAAEFGWDRTITGIVELYQRLAGSEPDADLR